MLRDLAADAGQRMPSSQMQMTDGRKFLSTAAFNDLGTSRRQPFPASRARCSEGVSAGAPGAHAETYSMSEVMPFPMQ
jgi:hypothetical protein